jgi:hypothetical protein
MPRIAKPTTAVATAVMVLLSAVSPVLATVYKAGTKWCLTNQTPYSKSFSTGFTEHAPPGAGYQAWNNGSNWIVRQKFSNPGVRGGDWAVAVTNGSLNDPGTFAGCVNGTQ